MASELSFRPQSMPATAYLGLAFGTVLFLFALSSLIFADHGAFEIIGGIVVLLLGAIVLQSGAYALWGQLHLRIDSDDWCTVTWRLGRFNRSKRFPRTAVRSVRIITADPSDGFMPSRTGTKVEFCIDRETRPLVLGGGFDLDSDSLQAISTFFGTDVAATALD